MRRAARRDALEGDIVQALRACGASVTILDVKGAPDLLVGFRGATWLLEAKTPSRKDGKAHKGKGGTGELTKAQVKWHSTWRGGPAVIVRGVDDALKAVGVTTGR
jgi:hypothetical protein